MTDHDDQAIVGLLRAAVPDLAPPPGRLAAVRGQVRRTRRRRTTAALLTAAAVAAGAAGWAALPARHPSTVASARMTVAELTTSACPSEQVLRQNLIHYPHGRIPDGFTPVTAVMCSLDALPTPGGGSYQALVERRGTTGIERLTRELRKPSTDPAPPAGGGCTLELRTIPWFTLADAAGRAIRPEVPMGVCDKPSPAAMKALSEVGWTVVHEQRLRTIESDRAHQAGCAQDYKDQFAQTLEPAAARAPAFTTPPSALHACVYSKASTTASTGTFASGGTASGPASAQVLAQLDSAPPATPCTTRARSFLTLEPAGVTNGAVSVELDGCLRVSREDQKLAQLTQAQVTALLAALPR
jgi:hypothetical protein